MGKIVYMVGDYASATVEGAESHAKAEGGEVEDRELQYGEILRKHRIVYLASAVHHQRNSPCVVLIQVDPQGRPFRLTVLPVGHDYIPRRDIMPFDVLVDVGATPKGEGDRALFAKSYGLGQLFDLFEAWFEKCGLGVSAIDEPRKFLPLFTTQAQVEVFKELHLSEFFAEPVRVLESIMAFSNDVDWVQGKDVRFGKNSYTQFATKCRYEIEPQEKGHARAHKVAMAYNYHLLTR